MKSISEILEDARNLAVEEPLESYEEVISTLREKGLSWREIADFLNQRGVNTDHTKVFRFVKSRAAITLSKSSFHVPSSDQYAECLKSISISELQRAMLRAHYEAHNRTATFTYLANKAGSMSYRTANSHYGTLGHAIGDVLGISFVLAENGRGFFYCSAIGMPNSYLTKGGEFELVMHHELAKALEQTNFFE